MKDDDDDEDEDDDDDDDDNNNEDNEDGKISEWGVPFTGTCEYQSKHKIKKTWFFKWKTLVLKHMNLCHY